MEIILANKIIVIKGETYMKKIISILLFVILIFSISIVANATESDKLTQELKEILADCQPEDAIGVYLWFNEKNVTAVDMPSWPDLAQARKELKEYYEEKHAEYFSVIFEYIEYKEIHISTSAVIVEVKAKDVQKIADYDIINYIGLYQNYIPEPFQYLYESDFINTFGQGTGYEYSEKYYHKNSVDEIEWCLVYAINTPGPPAPYYTVFDNYVSLQGDYIPFSTKYGIYDAKEEKFYDLKDIENFEKYENLIEQLLIYDEYMYPIGDADNDRKLTVMDATYIQMVEAKLCDYNESIDNLKNHFYTSSTEKISYISDFDRDGERTVLDATAIQLKLAKK